MDILVTSLKVLFYVSTALFYTGLVGVVIESFRTK